MTIPSMNQSTSAAGGIFVPVEISKELNMLIRDTSCVLQLAKHIPMKRRQLTRRLQSDGVEGYWVDAMATKTKDAPSFAPYTLTAEKLAVIIALEDQLLEDSDTDLASIIREDVVKAFAEMIDRTLMGYDLTTPFTQSLSGSTPAGNIVPFGTGVDLAADFSLAISRLEANGFEATGAIAHPRVKHLMRNLRDLNNQPLFVEYLQNEVKRYSFWGVPMCFTRQVQEAGSPLASEILLLYKPYSIVGDRVGLQVSKSSEATLTQGTEPDINLWETDMTAFRFVTRMGWVIKDTDSISKITGVVLE